MAREIVVEQDGRTSRFVFTKVDRAKLYGRRERVPLDPDGKRCTRAELTPDGAQLVRPGMSAQGYFDDRGAWVPQKDLRGIREDGTPADLAPSTLGEAQPLVEIEASAVLDLAVLSVYALDAEAPDDALRDALLAGRFRFAFNYRAGYQPDVAVLLANRDGELFALVGKPSEAEWVELEQVVEGDFGDDALDDELDFEMF